MASNNSSSLCHGNWTRHAHCGGQRCQSARPGRQTSTKSFACTCRLLGEQPFQREANSAIGGGVTAALLSIPSHGTIPWLHVGHVGVLMQSFVCFPASTLSTRKWNACDESCGKPEALQAKPTQDHLTIPVQPPSPTHHLGEQCYWASRARRGPPGAMLGIGATRQMRLPLAGAHSGRKQWPGMPFSGITVALHLQLHSGAAFEEGDCMIRSESDCGRQRPVLQIQGP